jgi:hypothetical protein
MGGQAFDSTALTLPWCGHWEKADHMATPKPWLIVACGENPTGYPAPKRPTGNTPFSIDTRSDFVPCESPSMPVVDDNRCYLIFSVSRRVLSRAVPGISQRRTSRHSRIFRAELTSCVGQFANPGIRQFHTTSTCSNSDAGVA